MSSSDPTPSFYSYSLTEMEGLNEICDVIVPDNTIPGNPLGNQFLYLSVKTDCGQPLSPTLFAKDVIEGMISMQVHTVGTAAWSSTRGDAVEWYRSRGGTQQKSQHGQDTSHPGSLAVLVRTESEVDV